MATDPSSIYLPPLAHPVRTIGGQEFDFSRQVVIMAIVNRTPDSFYDGGRTVTLPDAIEAVSNAAASGADWVDIGGQPFAPGPEISVDTELERVLPVIEAVRDTSGLVLSVETYRAEVARQAVAAGAHVINDTSGLDDPEMPGAVAGTGAALVITHSLAKPRTAHPRPAYTDVAAEVAVFLQERVAAALAGGVEPPQIIVDPGHDLNKNTHHSLELTRRLSEITSLGYPTLVSVSNKDFIGETLDAAVDERREGTVAALVACMMLGARVVRVHDVPSALAASNLTEAVLGLRPPATARHNLT